MKIRNLIFTLVIVEFLFFVGLYLLFNKTANISVSENRNLETVNFALIEDDLVNNYRSTLIQQNIENSFNDQFPFRNDMFRFKILLEFKFSSIARNEEPAEVVDDEIDKSEVKFVFDYKTSKTSIIKTEPSHYILSQVGETKVYYLAEYPSFYFNHPILEEGNRIETVNNRLQNISNLAQKYDEIDVYVYKPTQIHELDIFDNDNEILSLGTQFDDIFVSYMSQNYAKLRIDGFRQYSKLFYRTDHHWNNYGAQIGYEQIMSLIYPDEKTIKPVGEKCVDAVYNGTFSYRIGMINTPERYCVYDYEYKNYDLVSDEINWQTALKLNNEFLSNDKIDFNKFKFDHYVKVDAGIMRARNINEDGENILVIRDSFMNAVIPLLSNHFKNSYYVHPLYYKERYGEAFDIESFIIENDIDIVLFAYSIENYFHYPSYLNYEFEIQLD